MGDTIIDFLFLETNLNGKIYLDMLENIIDPLITQELENQIDEHGNFHLDSR